MPGIDGADVHRCSALDADKIVAQAKVPTTHADVLQCLLSALDKVMAQMPDVR